MYRIKALDDQWPIRCIVSSEIAIAAADVAKASVASPTAFAMSVNDFQKPTDVHGSPLLSRNKGPGQRPLIWR